ncbi:hypothetical protein [Algoriphagus aquimarinus]|nr:hypothetical protein [Algoriphagus aquimarinus]
MTLKPITSMVNTHDIYTSFALLDNEEQIIDSYEFLKSLIIDLEGQGTIRFKLNTTLPFIKGNPSYIKKTFKQFLAQVSNKLQEETGTIEIIHIRDRNSWIFGLLIQNITAGQMSEKINKKHIVSKFKLIISKKANMQFDTFLPE